MAMSKAANKAVTDFYGSKIHKGKLHKAMGVAPGSKIPVQKISSEIATLKNKKNKTKANVKKERELVFAKNAKTKFKH